MDVVIKMVLLLILMGCFTASPWSVSHLDDAESARLSYPIHDPVHGIGVEMVCVREGVRTYLEVHAQEVPPYLGHEKEAFVTLKTPQATLSSTAHRHAGGQRVLLTAELHDFLLTALIAGLPVKIELQGYFTTVQAEQFAEQYEHIKKRPLTVPIQLPFKL